MSSSFCYKKLPQPSDLSPTHATPLDADLYEAQAVAAARRSTARAPWRRPRPRRSWSFAGRRSRAPRRRLRISGLATVLRRVRASVAKVVGRFKGGGPYVRDLFAGNYMFLQVTPSASAPAAVAGLDKGFLPYYYAAINKSKGGGAAAVCTAGFNPSSDRPPC